jgi:hypothetical protein
LYLLLLLLFIIWPGKHAAECAVCARGIIFDYLARRVLSMFAMYVE